MDTVAPSMSTRITTSATGLAKQILYSPEETTSTFTDLRTANKGSVFRGNAGERHPKALSIRQRNGTIGLPTPSHSPETYSDVEFAQEFYGGGWGSASSSRAVSPLELDAKVELERNDSLDPEGFRDAWKHASETSDTSAAVSSGVVFAEEFWSSTYEGNAQPWDQRRLSQDERDKSWSLGASTSSLQQDDTQDSEADVGSRQRLIALERLRLLYSHLPAIHAAEKSATIASRNLQPIHLTTSRAVEKEAVDMQGSDTESTFNQFCHSEDALAWYEAGMSIGRVGQRTDWESGLVIAEATRMEGEFGVLERRMEEMPQVIRERFVESLKERAQERDLEKDVENGEKKKEKEHERENLPEFHCPWIECHRRFQICKEYIRDTKDAVDADVDADSGLPCVHIGCEDKFEDEGTWRRHVFVAHHDLLPLRPEVDVDMEGVWERNRDQD